MSDGQTGSEPRLPGASDPLTWQKLRAFYEEQERFAAEHPYVREIRCPWSVQLVLIAAVPRTVRGPLAPAARLTAIPIIVDTTVPAGHAQFLYSDGSSKEIEVIKLPAPEENPEPSSGQGWLSRILRWRRTGSRRS